MIVDTSALLAILLVENDAVWFADRLEDARTARISAVTYIELITVCDRRVGASAVADAEEMISRSGIELVPFTVEQARFAKHARLTYGAGRHPANLNFGDCFAYALAKSTGEPLLYKGNDFSHTDIATVV